MRVPVKHVWEIDVSTLALVGRSSSGEDDDVGPNGTLDPLTQGYALTGDQNIVHVAMAVSLPRAGSGGMGFLRATLEDILRVEVTAAMVRSLGEMGVDRVLADGRKSLDRDRHPSRAGGARRSRTRASSCRRSS